MLGLRPPLLGSPRPCLTARWPHTARRLSIRRAVTRAKAGEQVCGCFAGGRAGGRAGGGRTKLCMLLPRRPCPPIAACSYRASMQELRDCRRRGRATLSSRHQTGRKSVLVGRSVACRSPPRRPSPTPGLPRRTCGASSGRGPRSMTCTCTTRCGLRGAGPPRPPRRTRAPELALRQLGWRCVGCCF